MSEPSLDVLMQQATALHNAARLEEAARIYLQILELDSSHDGALHGMGLALCQANQLDAGLQMLGEAVSVAPTNGQYRYHLAAGLEKAGKIDEAIDSYRRASELSPHRVEPLVNGSLLLMLRGQLTEAEQWLRRAVANDANPQASPVFSNLAGVLQKQGRGREAIECCRRSLQVNPGLELTQHSLLLWVHYDGRHDPDAIYAEHLKWGIRFDELTARAAPHGNDRSPERRLRVGYVSPDLREHPVTYFLEPLLANHDHERHEIFCYADQFAADEVTARLRSHSDVWREVTGLSHEAVAERIRADAIDVLVELSGHTDNNRLAVFALKPAPVQVSYLGYPDTTGLSAMDYRLTDVHADPRGASERWHRETLVRLPRTAWCYRPPGDAPEVNVRAPGTVTFGSFNMLVKVSDRTLDAWAEILKRVPASKMLIKNRALSDEGVRERYRSEFQSRGVDPNRIELRAGSGSHGEHLASYHDVDIALDTFPYAGTTTTCEAMWMGVPVVTLAGEAHAGRVGVSLLRNVNLGELIATSAEEYARIAVDLANDPTRLAGLRSSLRDWMANSPLMDGAAFARDVEDAYRTMWKRWCSR